MRSGTGSYPAGSYPVRSVPAGSGPVPSSPTPQPRRAPGSAQDVGSLREDAASVAPVLGCAAFRLDADHVEKIGQEVEARAPRERRQFEGEGLDVAGSLGGA